MARVQVAAIDNGYHVSLNALGRNHDLKLHKISASPSTSVLNEGLQVLTIGDPTDPSAELQTGTWRPSSHELASAQDLYHDPAANAIFRVHQHLETDEHRLSGLVDGFAISHDGIEHVVHHAPQEPLHADYIDLGRNLTLGSAFEVPDSSTRVTAVAELVIVCDKEFGDVFSHNRQRILDYLTVYLWDLNNRYRTLPSDSISFRLNGLILIATTAGQPFIENARAPDGRAEFGRILEPYSYWVYQQMGGWPAFDLAPLMTNTALEWRGGLAYMNAACWIHSAGRHIGTAVWNDEGTWHSLTVGAHELGHNLGAPHDDDTDYPGGCSDRGYIMAGATNELRWYFSSCSDRTISAFIRSTGASCLQQLAGTPILDPGHTSPAAPDMEEQCRRMYGSTAFVQDEDKGNCLVMRCWVPRPEGGWLIYSVPPVDNTICNPAGGTPGRGRCFRGNCRAV